MREPAWRQNQSGGGATLFSMAETPDPFDIIDDSEPPPSLPEEMLDRRRIARVTKLKVATLRSRRTAIVWTIVSAFGTIAFARTAYQSLQFGNRYPLILGIISLICAYHAFDFARQFVRLNRELTTAPPDD